MATNQFSKLNLGGAVLEAHRGCDDSGDDSDDDRRCCRDDDGDGEAPERTECGNRVWEPKPKRLTKAELRAAKEVEWCRTGLSSDDLALLGTLCSVLPALETLWLCEPAAGPDGVQRLAEKLGAGALPAVIELNLNSTHVGDAGASALAAALGRGALPRLQWLDLNNAAIGDAGLVALAPALRRRPALEKLYLGRNPLGDEGLAALVAPPPPAGAPPTTTGGLAKLETLVLSYSQVTNAGCAALAAALDSGVLSVLKTLDLNGIPASETAKAAPRRCVWLRRRALF